MFNFRTVSELVLDRKRKCLQKFCSCDKIICETLAFMAKDELSSLRSASEGLLVIGAIVRFLSFFLSVVVVVVVVAVFSYFCYHVYWRIKMHIYIIIVNDDA